MKTKNTKNKYGKKAFNFLNSQLNLQPIKISLIIIKKKCIKRVHNSKHYFAQLLNVTMLHISFQK